MTQFVLPPRVPAGPPIEIRSRSRARHRLARRSVLMIVASVTGLMALALAVAVSFSGLFA